MQICSCHVTLFVFSLLFFFFTLFTSSDSKEGPSYPYCITSLTDKHEFLQNGDDVRFKLCQLESTGPDWACNMAAVRTFWRAKVDFIKGQVRCLNNILCLYARWTEMPVCLPKEDSRDILVLMHEASFLLLCIFFDALSDVMVVLGMRQSIDKVGVLLCYQWAWSC